MAMNIFRALGDACHVLSIIVLLIRLRLHGRASGVSLKTQELYFAVFITRYIDLFYVFYSLYNSMMKIFYVSVTAFIIHTIRLVEPAKSTYSSDDDSFQHSKTVIVSCALIPLFLSVFKSWGTYNYYYGDFDLLEYLWTFSVCLEPMAMVPQLLMFRANRQLDHEVQWYICFRGLYRALYICNWVYRSYNEPMYRHHFLVYICGGIQTLLYGDFFLYHLRLRCGLLNDLDGNSPSEHQSSANVTVTSAEEDGDDGGLSTPLLSVSEENDIPPEFSDSSKSVSHHITVV